MMFSTHILAGATLGLLASFLSPSMVPVAVLAGMIGGLLPDIDMFFEHRKTTHRPFQYLALVAVFSVAFFFQGGAYLLFAAFLLGSMTLHSFMEIFSNGKTMRPKKETDDRAVYNHFAGNWIEPRRTVIDASFRDLLCTVVFSIPVLIHGAHFYLTSAVLAWGIVYFLMADRLKEKMAGYERFSQFFQHMIGFGPEVN